MTRPLGVGLVLVALIASSAFCVQARADAYHVILSGSGGEDEFSDRFRDWGNRLRRVLTQELGAPTANVFWLAEPQTADAPPETTANLDSIRALFAGLGDRLVEDDSLFVYLIGHGAYIKSKSMFQLPGPDLTAEELDRLLDTLPADQLCLLNATSASAGFVNVLSGAGRVVCAATKSVRENNATEYMEYFIQGLEDGSSDRNHDERISFLEACQQATELTESWYTANGLISTEHAILDDNDDALGTRLPLYTTAADAADPEGLAVASDLDGSIADVRYIRDFYFGENVPQELIDTYLATLDDIAALKVRKPEMDVASYYVELEGLLLTAARTNREIHTLGRPRDPDS